MDRYWVYNGLDTMVTLEVLHKIEEQLDHLTGPTYNVSRALQGPVLEMTIRGIKIDERRRQQVLLGTLSEIKKVSEQLDRIVREGIGVSLNWRSTKDLKSLFYDVLGFKPIKKRGANGQSTVTVNREALEKLSLNLLAEPICVRLLRLRDLDKKRQFLETRVDSDGRIRTNINIGGTDTGRLASSLSDFGTGGNLQNVDRDLREIFVADPGMKFCNIDLEQADARNVGAICWNLFLERRGPQYAGAYLDACESGDLHTRVARMAFRSLEWPQDPEAWRAVADILAYRQDSYRQLAKKLGHGTNFAGQPRTMALHTKVATDIIKDFQHDYFEAFGCCKERIEWTRRTIEEKQTLINLFGRRRIFFGDPRAGETHRQAFAYDPQSSTAEEINRGILQMWGAHRVWFHLQVHDSILVQYHEEEEAEIVPWLLRMMRVPLRLAGGREFVVPLEAKVGWNWGEFHEHGPKCKRPCPIHENLGGLKKWKV